MSDTTTLDEIKALNRQTKRLSSIAIGFATFALAVALAQMFTVLSGAIQA